MKYVDSVNPEGDYEVGAVYGAVAAILSSLSVEKNGDLPSNMGGKPYITAVDLALEVKRQFVANNLIIVPNERVIKHENLVSNRTTVSIVIEGTYEIVSTVDGSSVTISGVGDGLAIGTAVASNIASTNALKNALLRFLLVTEQSTEDAAKQGTPEEVEAPVKGEPKLTVEDYKTKISEHIQNPDSPYDSAIVNAIGDRIAGSTPNNRKWTLTHYKGILKAIENGEVE